MVDLNKQRIAVYAYFLIVFTLIFGLSFAVKGDKITGSFVLETAGNFIGNISLFFVPMVIFGFLLSLAFSFFVIRHAREIKKEIKPEKAKFFAAIVVVLLSVSFISFGLYFENSEDKIYLVKLYSKAVIDVKEENYGYSWKENDLNYRLKVSEGNEIKILEVQNE